MTKLLLPLLLAITVSCSHNPWCEDKFQPPTLPQPANPCRLKNLAGRFDPDLQPHLSQFAADARDHDVGCYYTADLTIQNGGFEFSNTVVGYCQRYFRASFRQRYWEAASDTQKLVLLYHELGHCALHLEHDDSKPDIMNAAVLHEAYARRNWDELVDELFARARDKQ